MANNYWALVFRNKVVEVFTEAPTGEYHDAFSIITTSEKPVYGQDVVDGILAPAIEPIPVIVEQLVEPTDLAPELTPEEVAKAIADGQAALTASGTDIPLDLGPKHTL